MKHSIVSGPFQHAYVRYRVHIPKAQREKYSDFTPQDDPVLCVLGGERRVTLWKEQQGEEAEQADREGGRVGGKERRVKLEK